MKIRRKRAVLFWGLLPDGELVCIDFADPHGDDSYTALMYPEVIYFYADVEPVALEG